MTQFIGNLALIVADYDEAIAYYRDVLGFELIKDSDLGNGNRWDLLQPAS